jgi:hypothetical protein
MKIAFDIGGVLSKYPDIFRPIVTALEKDGIECHIVTDMPDRKKTLAMLETNGFGMIPESRVHNADYSTHGELCKSVVLRQIGADMLIDDHPGYLTEGCPVRLHLCPDPHKPYDDPNWKK